MKFLLLFFLVVLIAAGFGFFAYENPGTVVITYGHWMVSTHFWVAVVVVIVGFILFYGLIRVFKNIAALPSMISNHLDMNRERKQREYAAEAYCDYIKGNYEKAEKYFIKATENNSFAYLDYLKAAKAAQKCGHVAERNGYLQKAAQFKNHDTLVVALVEARLKIKNKEWDDALLILKNLQEQYPKNQAVLKSLEKIREKMPVEEHNHYT